MEIEKSNSDNFLESNENCSGTIHPGQTNNFLQLNDLVNNFSFTNSSLQLNGLPRVNNFSFTNSSLQLNGSFQLNGLPQVNNLVNNFSFTNGSTQANDFSFINSSPYYYHDFKFWYKAFIF